jgi:hypothetical protein
MSQHPVHVGSGRGTGRSTPRIRSDRRAQGSVPCLGVPQVEFHDCNASFGIGLPGFRLPVRFDHSELVRPVDGTGLLAPPHLGSGLHPQSPVDEIEFLGISGCSHCTGRRSSRLLGAMADVWCGQRIARRRSGRCIGSGESDRSEVAVAALLRWPRSVRDAQLLAQRGLRGIPVCRGAVWGTGIQWFSFHVEHRAGEIVHPSAMNR